MKVQVNIVVWLPNPEDGTHKDGVENSKKLKKSIGFPLRIEDRDTDYVVNCGFAYVPS